MTPEEIIEMAKQAGFDEHHAKFDTRIETFAKLVAEKERESCVKLCEEQMRGKSIWVEGAIACAAAIKAKKEKNK